MNIAIHGEKTLLHKFYWEATGVHGLGIDNEFDKYYSQLSDNGVLHIEDDVLTVFRLQLHIDEYYQSIHHLTPSNYNEVLENILKSVKNKQND